MVIYKKKKYYLFNIFLSNNHPPIGGWNVVEIFQNKRYKERGNLNE